MPDPARLSDLELATIRGLRSEANDVKDCFTRYSLQALAFSAALLGLIMKYQAEGNDLVGATSILVILLLICVCRMGTHKFATANRHFGYQLHLERLVSIPDGLRSPLDQHIRNVGWEEAMRAWRIVQATLYEALYDHPDWWPHRPKRKYRDEPFQWFRPEHIRSGASYYAGSYLHTMLEILYVSIAFALAVLGWWAFLKWPASGEWWYSRDFLLRVAIALPIGLVTGLHVIQIEARRKALEGGILSIHSCALMWHAVTTAHVRALDALSKSTKCGPALRGYRHALGHYATRLAKKPLALHEWIGNDEHSRPPEETFYEELN